MGNAKVIDLKERKGHQQREPFVPMTGNPENGDYLDYFRLLPSKSEVVHLPDKKESE